jgi:ketosteroid isomerase-like protein
MSAEKVEMVRARYEQFARGDFSQMADVAANFELVTTPEDPDGGTYRGENAIRWLTSWVESFDGSRSRPPRSSTLATAWSSPIFQQGRPRGSQTVVEGHWWRVLTFRGDVVARTETFQALEGARPAE